MSLNFLTVGEFSGDEFQRTESKSRKKNQKIIVLCSRSPENMKTSTFTSWSYNHGKEMHKNRQQFSFVKLNTE